MSMMHIMNENERKRILDDIHVGIWRIEEAPGQPPRMFGDANMYDILGAAPETRPEELFRFWHSRIEPVYLSYVDNAVDRLIATGEPAEVEYIWNHPQLGRTVVRCDATLVSSPESGKIGMLGMHRDITDKLTNHSWEDKSHHIVDPYKLSLCGRHLFKAYEDIFFVDRAAGRLHPVAYRRGPALSMEDSWDLYDIIETCVPPADRERVHSLFSQASMEKIIAGSSSASADFRRLNSQGGYCWVRGTLYPFPINGMEELLFVVQDIQNEQKVKTLKAEKEDVLYSIIHSSSVIYEWDIGDPRMRVLKHDLQHKSHPPVADSAALPELVEQLCGHYLDASDHPKARAFLRYETMAECAAEQRKRSVTLLLDSAYHKYNWVKMSILPSSLSRTKVYLMLEMMDRKEGLYPILESIIQKTADYCYCIDLKTDDFFRFIGDDSVYDMPAREGDSYTREMENHVNRFVVEEEREQVKKQMSPEHVLRKLQTKPEYSFVENVIDEHGQIRKKRLTFTPFHQSKGYVLLQSTDITELSSKDRMLEAVRRESVTDPLTQLYNRLGGERLIQEALNQPSEMKNAVMILLDLDNFKQVNDRFGHPVGDQVLRETARKLRDSFRSGDILYRLGGDEYAIFLKSMSHRDDIHPILNRLVEEMHIACKQDGTLLTVTASVGAVFYRGQSFEELYRQADAALYQAKAKKSGYSLFEEAGWKP